MEPATTGCLLGALWRELLVTAGPRVNCVCSRRALRPVAADAMTRDSLLGVLALKISIA